MFAACKQRSQEKRKHHAVSQNTPGIRTVSEFLIPEKSSFLQKHVPKIRRLMEKIRLVSVI